MKYQIMYERNEGWVNCWPDGYGMHNPAHGVDEDYMCDGCWNPNSDDPEVWFDLLKEEGNAIAARAGDEERIFDSERFA